MTSVVWSEAEHTKTERRVMTVAYVAALATGVLDRLVDPVECGRRHRARARRGLCRVAARIGTPRCCLRSGAAGPDRDHARWYCDRCGRTWDAAFESATRPRVISTGHDEAKAVKAAARADAVTNSGAACRPSAQAPGLAPLGLCRNHEPDRVQSSAV